MNGQGDTDHMRESVLNQLTDTNDPLESLAQLRAALNQVMLLEGHQLIERGNYEFYGELTVDSADAFDHIYERFTALNYTPMLFRRSGQVVVLAQRGVVRPRPLNARVNLILLVLTIFSTLFIGAIYAPSDALKLEVLRNGGDWLAALLQQPVFWLEGLPYTLALLGILGIHEMGHYVAGRIHKAAVTLPYFIPMPFGLGTMGAVILLREPIKNRRQLFDIGVAGPLAGFIIALPLIIIGLSNSPVEFIPNPEPNSQEGNSILYFGLKYLIFGRALPNGGFDVILNSVAFAAWLGLFITAVNLLPIGSLDGGHVTYSVFGQQQWRIARVVWGLMLVGGIILLVVYNQVLNIWLLWAFLLQGVFGLRHPPPLDDITPLDGKRRLIGIFTMILFVLLIVPVPFS